jgi:Ca2+:H+ antiporter
VGVLASALGVHIAVGSAAQIALFVAPVLVLSSFLIGPFPGHSSSTGSRSERSSSRYSSPRRSPSAADSTWFEGLQLLAVYAVLALTFFFV